MSRSLKIGVVGLGQRLAHVLLAMRETGVDVKLMGVVDPNPVGAPILLAESLNLGPRLPSVEALGGVGGLDLVMIGSPNHLHLQHLLAAFDLGAPIFCEKPVVRTEAETLKLAKRLAAGAAPPLFIGLVMRSMPIVKDVLARAASGALGTLISIDATEHLPPEHGGYLARNWRRRSAWGGSFLLDKVCHDFDVFNALAGGRPTRAASFGGRKIFTPERAAARTYSDGVPAYAGFDAGWAGAATAFEADMDVADHQTAILEYAQGLTLSFHCNSQTALQERRWYIAGTEGTLIADLVRNRLLFRGVFDLGRPERVDFGGRTEDNHNGADQAMAKDLLAALDGDAPFPATALSAMEAGLTVMALDRAMEIRRTVDLASLWRRFDRAWA
jgi:predicted dehydrogenase